MQSYGGAGKVRYGKADWKATAIPNATVLTTAVPTAAIPTISM